MKERVDPIINRPSLIYLKSMHLLSDPSTREELITIVPKRDTTIITTRKGLSSITEFALRDNRGWMTTYSQYLSISNWSIQMQSTIGERSSGTMGEKNIPRRIVTRCTSDVIMQSPLQVWLQWHVYEDQLYSLE